MKLLKVACIAIVVNIALFMNGAYAQTPTILIDGIAAIANNVSVSPYWLHAGQTLASGNKVNSISVLQYNIAPAIGGGKSLQFDSIISVTIQQAVPASKAWKIESVSLDPTASPIMQGIQGATGATGPVVAGTSGQTLRNDGAGWIANSLLFNNGTNVGIGTTSPLELLSIGTSGTTAGIISLAGASSGKAIIQTATAAGTPTLTLPAVTGSLSTLAGAEILTNKTITDNTNNVMAKSLKSVTTTVDVSTATAPTTGQVLTATSGTAANWQTPAGGTKEFLVPIPGMGHTYNDGYANAPDTKYAINETPRVLFIIPSDFTSLISAQIIGIGNTAGGTQSIGIWCSYGAVGEPINNHGSYVDPIQATAATNVIYAFNISSVLTNIAAGDYVGFYCNANTELRLLGLRIKYQ